MFHWKKLGNIFCPENNYPWMVSHAANPFPVFLDENIIRIYFTSRDNKSRSHVGYVNVDAGNGFKVIEISKKPVVEPGALGYFDDSGAAMGCHLEHNKKKYLYYLGWNLKVTVPWQNSIGLAVAQSGSDTFVKVSQAPIMDRSHEDPFSISYPSVLFENHKFRMWYGSNLSWGPDQDKMNHVIKYAESEDGVHWKRSNQVCINLKYPNEYAISKPHVLKIGDIYCMWYSFRGSINMSTYRIGYAESRDGLNWERKDELAGIDLSDYGWDFEMICYPTVFSYKDKYYMLYNGNGYGRTGFGIAINEHPDL